MQFVKTAATLASLLLFSACANSVMPKADDAVTEVAENSTDRLAEAKSPLPPMDTRRVRDNQGVWTTSVSYRSEHGAPLPPQFEGANGVTLVHASPLELFQIGTEVTKNTGIPVQFGADIFADETFTVKDESSSSKSSGADSTAIGPGIAVNSFEELINGPASGNSSNSSNGLIKAVVGSRQKMKMDHVGKLSSFLDRVSAHFGVTWTYEGGEIRIFRFVTRTYSVEALPSDIEVRSTLDAGSETSSSGGDESGSNQSARSNIAVKIWDDMTASVESIVSNAGRVTASVSTSTITVTAPVDVIRRVQAYIDGQNARMSKQVAVSLQVLNVTLSENEDYSLDIQGLFSGSSKYGFSFGNSAVATALQTGIPGLNFGIVNPDSNWSGSSSLIKALSERGRVSVVSTAAITTLNGIPAPVQVAKTRNFLERVEVTTGETDTTTSLTPGTVTTGFNLSLLPRVLDDNQTILLQFGINISELVGENDGFDEFSVNGMTIQLPNKNSRNFVQQTMIPNGRTLVLSGFEQVRNQANKSGAGNPDFMLLGGSRQATQSREVIVVIVTPVLLESRPAISTYY
ncbi:PilN family type IVB pilus formation outer membrane protein [Thalassospira xianhensis]|uniref:Type II/III secretion system secretin-like domain-containing protein n=1 Tax=Thalassospira xianhensis MCCC 1A02616 TaxID=1177929 RepID=A0A367UKF2_9PROT|nr:PilN family type IVB pilus formation outer membrane protein [Thalassospira xianhensis]RCK07814.1 hypothetical protein TH5_01885 [Thalassospira xianhensis MCCC 1A02616]